MPSVWVGNGEGVDVAGAGGLDGVEGVEMGMGVETDGRAVAGEWGRLAMTLCASCAYESGAGDAEGCGEEEGGKIMFFRLWSTWLELES
jgi:hypothetical protein